MNSTARPVPVNTVDRHAFRDMCAHFARREIAPRWQEADRTRTFPREFLVAAARAGLPLTYYNFRANYWMPALKACSLPYVTPHSARHTSTQAPLTEGAPDAGRHES